LKPAAGSKRKRDVSHEEEWEISRIAGWR
jgi:hypothetical protein